MRQKSFADRHGCQDLYNLSHQYIESHFTDVLSSDEFIELEANEVAALISSDTISVCSEEKIYEAALAWVQHDPNERGKNLPEVRIIISKQHNDYLPFIITSLTI